MKATNTLSDNYRYDICFTVQPINDTDTYKHLLADIEFCSFGIADKTNKYETKTYTVYDSSGEDVTKVTGSYEYTSYYPLLK